MPTRKTVNAGLPHLEAELQAMKDMLAEIRQSWDDWKAQAERHPFCPAPRLHARL